MRRVKQYEAVIKVMEENGGYATLGYLNQRVLDVPGCEWRTKTPFASIRRIVQDSRFFFKIRPGLWALKSYRGKLPEEILPQQGVVHGKQEEFGHTYYQGLLVELGNLCAFKTTVPAQDKNRKFLGKRLADVVTLARMYSFSYDHLVHIATSIDVVWFNDRQMPENLFEVEHTTDIRNSLLKFVELQDFNTGFFVVADKARRREFDARLSLQAFVSISERVNFWSYDNLAELHAKTSEYVATTSSGPSHKLPAHPGRRMITPKRGTP